MKVITVLFLVILFGVLGFGQIVKYPEFPDTTEGKRGAAFLNLINTTDKETLDSFIKDEMAPNADTNAAERVESLTRMRSFLGESKLRRIVSVDKKAVIFIVETKRGSFASIKLNLNTEENPRIANIQFERVSEDELTKKIDNTKYTEADAIAATDKLLKELAEKDKFSGTVLVAKNGVPIFSKAYGYADREKKLTNNLETKYNIGSINKLFTMLSIGFLVDEGKLSLEDTIGKILPDYPNKDAREKVNITHLLTMSSGIGDIFGDEYEATPKSKLRDISSYLPLFASKALAFEPGTDRQYSNGGFLVLGAIIEKASGQTYYDFVRDRITKPIGMKDSESFLSTEEVPNRAEGYTFDEDKKALTNNALTRPERGSSGGGGYSTAPDLLKFSNALETGKFKTPDSLMTTDDDLLKGLAGGTLRFAGGSLGINAMLLNRISDEYTVIVLTNYDPPSASDPARQIMKWLEK